MMNMKRLFSILSGATITGTLKKPLSLLTDDSRKVIPGCCYVAVKGTQFDGHTAIEGAIASGAAAIVAETPVTTMAQVIINGASRKIHPSILKIQWNF